MAVVPQRAEVLLMGFWQVGCKDADEITDVGVECDVTITDTNSVTLGFAVAPSASSIRVVIIG